jgi:putative spermidine/putrescine transport system substrate-binding protein
MNRSRMRVACTAGVLVVLTAVAACSNSSGGKTASTPSKSALSGVVNVSTWGGVWTDAEKKYWGDPFTQETGVKVNYLASGNSPMAPALLQAQSGKMSLDIVFAENAEVLFSKNLTADFPPDLMAIMKDKLLPTEFSAQLIKIGNTATLIACNPAVMKRCPTNPKEFWDTKNFPGPRAIGGTPDNVMAFALEADGVLPDKLFPMDIDRAIKKLKEIKPQVKVWPGSGAEQQKVLIDKEVGAEILWNGRAFVVKRDNIPALEMYWDGALVASSNGLVVMKDGPNKAAAFAYIKWILEHPENQAKWTEALTYPTPTKELLKLIPANIAAGLPGAHKNVTSTDDKWINENLPAIQKAWQNFLAS